MRLLPCVVLLGIVSAVSLQAKEKKNLDPHVHGEGKLSFVVDSKSGDLELNLKLPALQVLGFEHQPKTDAEKKTHSESHIKLKDHKSVFTLISSKTAKADCKFSYATLKIPYMEDETHAHDHGHKHSDHADYELSYRMKCKNTKAIEGFQIVAFQNLKGLTKLKVEGLVDDKAVAQDMSAGNIDLLIK